MIGINAFDDVNSIESEAGVIASLIHHPDFSFYSEQLLPRHFVNKDNRCIYQAICNLAKAGITSIDPFNIIENLNSSEATRKYADALSIEKLQELMDVSHLIARHTVEEYRMLVSNILNTAFRRDALKKLQDCMELCRHSDQGDIEKQIYSMIDEVMVGYSSVDDVPEFSEVVDELWEEVEAHQDGKDAGIPFKFPTLNEYVRIEPGELVVVAAPAKGAKSMFMLNEAVDILRKGKSVMYIDSELSSRLFLCRLISHLAGIDFSRVRSGRYTEEERKMIKKQVEWIKKQKLVHMYMPIFDKQTIYTAVKRVSHRLGGLDVLIVDYLKPTGASNEAYTVYSELGSLTDLIKNEICGNLGIAGLAAAQLNNNNRIADSAKITRNASTILILLEKTLEEIEMDGEGSGRKKLMVTQNRNGMQHVEGEWINLDFNGNICLLEEASVKHVPELPY